MTTETMGLDREIIQVRQHARQLYDEAAMNAVYDRLAEEISRVLSDKNPILLPVLTGGIYFCGQLMQRLNFALELDYLHATRYRENTTGSQLHWQARPSNKITGRTVLVIDDILDQGITLHQVLAELRNAGVADLYSAVLTRKQCAREREVEVDFVGVDVPDRYVFGCGMDYHGYWRNLPAIYAVADS